MIHTMTHGITICDKSHMHLQVTLSHQKSFEIFKNILELTNISATVTLCDTV
jgi:hypothetical protein